MQPILEYLTIEGWRKDLQETRERHPRVASPLENTRDFFKEQSKYPHFWETIRDQPGYVALSSVFFIYAAGGSAFFSYLSQTDPKVFEQFPTIMQIIAAGGIATLAKVTYHAATKAQQRAKKNKDRDNHFNLADCYGNEEYRISTETVK